MSRQMMVIKSLQKGTQTRTIWRMKHIVGEDTDIFLCKPDKE